MKGIIAEEISKRLPDQAILIHRHDDKSGRHEISVRNTIPKAMSEYIERLKKSKELISFGGRDGAWAGLFNDEQFETLMKLINPYKNKRITETQKGYLWKKHKK
ncbi:MAG: hypothetical protein U9O53_02715 [archaeon]|nr:hypothetical protein [archaeon]